jgi:hypothetical protein
MTVPQFIAILRALPEETRAIVNALLKRGRIAEAERAALFVGSSEPEEK